MERSEKLMLLRDAGSAWTALLVQTALSVMPSVKSTTTWQTSALTLCFGLNGRNFLIHRTKPGTAPEKNETSPEPLPVAKIAQDPSLRGETVNLGEGAKGPCTCQFTRLRVIEHKGGRPLNELWLLLRMNSDGEIKYMLSNAPEDIPFLELVRVSQLRWIIEQLFQEGKSYLGLDEYEMRSYPGLHRHMALVNVVMHFLLTVRIEFGLKKTISP